MPSWGKDRLAQVHESSGCMSCLHLVGWMDGLVCSIREAQGNDSCLCHVCKAICWTNLPYQTPSSYLKLVLNKLWVILKLVLNLLCRLFFFVLSHNEANASGHHCYVCCTSMVNLVFVVAHRTLMCLSSWRVAAVQIILWIRLTYLKPSCNIFIIRV